MANKTKIPLAGRPPGASYGKPEVTRAEYNRAIDSRNFKNSLAYFKAKDPRGRGDVKRGHLGEGIIPADLNWRAGKVVDDGDIDDWTAVSGTTLRVWSGEANIHGFGESFLIIPPAGGSNMNRLAQRLLPRRTMPRTNPCTFTSG